MQRTKEVPTLSEWDENSGSKEEKNEISSVTKPD